MDYRLTAMDYHNIVDNDEERIVVIEHIFMR